MKKTIKNYVSPIDNQLAEFDKTHVLSNSQLAEIKKYKKINSLRDQKTPLITTVPSIFTF